MSDAGAVATARVACKHHAPPSCTTAGIGEKRWRKRNDCRNEVVRVKQENKLERKLSTLTMWTHSLIHLITLSPPFLLPPSSPAYSVHLHLHYTQLEFIWWGVIDGKALVELCSFSSDELEGEKKNVMEGKKRLSAYLLETKSQTSFFFFQVNCSQWFSTVNHHTLMRPWPANLHLKLYVHTTLCNVRSSGYY